MRLVPVESVREGSYLAKTIYDDDGRVLLRDGVQLTDLLLRRIKFINISSIYINDEYSDNIIEDIIKPELRQKAIKTIKETFFSFEKYNLYSSKNISPAKQTALIKERQNYFKSISEISNSILEDILNKKNVLINIVDIKSMDNYTYQHSVNVAVLSLILGIQLQLNRYELHSLCMGALLHDMGKVFIPKDVLGRPDKLTNAEFSLVQEHSLKGYEYLKNSSDISATSRIIALQHHERENGQGYPENRKGSETNKLAKIVAIADVYDALTSDRPYRRAISPNEAVEYILASGGILFDYEVVKAFSRAVVPYPEGTMVKMSNGDIAVISEVNPHFPLRPKVKIVKSNNLENTKKQMDLFNELGIVIEDIVYNIGE